MLSKEYLDTARSILRAAQTMTDQHVAGHLKALSEDYERRAEKAAHADAAKALKQGSTLMNVIIQNLNGLWHLIVGSCQIRTPFLETQDRALVVAYARRVYPGAKILERD
jgi:hypothetical protein